MVEVLLAAVRPWQLLAGKVLGIGVLGLVQFGVTILLAAVAITITGLFDLPELPLVNVANLVLWFVLGFVVYAVLYGTAGALVNRMEDAQTTALPVTLLAGGGFFVSIAALDDPNGVVALVGTLIPLTAPFVVPVRAVLGAITVWEYLAAIVITVGSIVLLIMLAGRIYAGGLLRYGSRVKVTEAWRSATE